ncbi:Glycoside hydrolase family 76 protein [Mycena indigotica]|uniref:receptor protein-tyrosine kinase n=1 Tax=Mycena indigotica TaxID=2126181 RepID=A0A8H6S1M1_9AGAR|nr:Glycoside hydrolase family 76 protein [Mycena indigotica]KAF7290663.1 Glycoside hydrolase family 76 protein [Mycena indigotica]
MPLSFSLVFGVSCIAVALADQVPSSWRQANITTSVADRISTAKAAIDEAVFNIDTSSGQFPDPGAYGLAGTLLSQLAEFDHATNQSIYQDKLLNLWPAAAKTVSGLGGVVNLTGSFNYGHAAATAYKVYNNPSFLPYAEQSWWAANGYTISAADLKNGSTSVKNYTLSTNCVGITMAGGTFRAKDKNDPTINALSTGGFLALSALLAESTKNPIYLDAATLSLDFMHAHLYNVQNLVQDSISAVASQGCSSSSLLAPQNSGLMLEGIAVLYSITGNATLQDLAGSIVSAALSTTSWQGANGIIAPGDVFLPRGLNAVYTRNALPTTLRTYVAAYLGVQFNALTTLARANGSNIFGPFTGPPSTFSPTNQTNAISALIAAINANPSSESKTGANPPSSQSSSIAPVYHSSSSNTGAIVGGVVGGLAVLVILGFVFFLLWRRRKHKQSTVETDLNDAYPPTRVFRQEATTSPTPFMINSSVVPSTTLSTSVLPSSETASYQPASSHMSDSQSNSGSSAAADSNAPLRSGKARLAVIGSQPNSPSDPETDLSGRPISSENRAQIPTDELVRLLYTRMNGQPNNVGHSGQQNEEAPPEYS